MEKGTGGVLMTAFQINALLANEFPNGGLDKKVYGLAFKAIGLNARGPGNHSSEIKVYSIYKINGKLRYIGGDSFEPKNGKFFNTTRTQPETKNIKFEHYRKMTNQAGTNDSFCFAFIKRDDLIDFMSTIKKGEEFSVLITSILFSHQGKDAFGLALQEDGATDGEVILTAPCPPYWKLGPPTKDKDAYLEEIKLLKELAEGEFC